MRTSDMIVEKRSPSPTELYTGDKRNLTIDAINVHSTLNINSSSKAAY